MRSELSTQFYELLLQGRELIETPDNTLRAYLDFTRILLKDYGIREDDTLQTIVNTLDKIYRDELSDANLPPSEIIEKGFEELQKQEVLVKESREHAAEAGKADQKRQEQTLAQRLRAQASLQAQAVIAEQKQPVETTIYQPKPAVADIPDYAVPAAIGEPIRAMAQEAAKQEHIVFTPNQIDLIIKRTYQAEFPVPLVPEAIKTEVTAQLEQTLNSLPTLEPQVAENLKTTLEELVIRQTAGAPEEKIDPRTFQENIRLVIQERAGIAEIESGKIAEAVIKTAAPVETWVQKAEIVIPLAELAKEVPQAGTSVPAELKEQLRDQIKEIITEQHTTIPEEKLNQVAEKLTDQTIVSLSSTSPQKTTALKSFVQTTLEENGVIFVDRQKLDSFTNQVVDSAQPIQRWIQTAPVVAPVIAKMPTGESFSVLETKMQDTVQAVFENDSLFKNTSPEKIQAASKVTSELFISQTLSPDGWKANQLLEPTKVFLEKQGLGFTNDEVRTVLGKIETVGQPTIIALEKTEKPIPEAVYAKLTTEPQGVSPIRRITASFERVVTAPAAGAIINTPDKTPEWKEIADGKFGERYLEGAKTLVDAGMPKSHPTVVRLEEKGRRLLAVQQENGRDKPATAILKRYHRLNQQRIFDKDLGTYLPQTSTFKQISFRLPSGRRFVSFVTNGRFTSFGSVQSTIYQKTFGRVAVAFGKSKIGQSASAFVAKQFGVALVKKGAVSAGVAAGAAAGLFTGGIATLITAAVTILPKAFSFIKNKLGLSSKTSGALIAGGMAIGGLFALATGGLTALGVGLLAIGGGSLLAMAPGFGIGVGGAISGLANGTGSILSAIGAGSATGAPIAAGVAVGAGSIGFLAFVIIMIASGAFILPTGGGGGPTFPWTGTSSTCPAQFPVIPAPAGLIFTWPVGQRPCSSNFGNRLDPFSPTECKCHTGIDIPGLYTKDSNSKCHNSAGSPENIHIAAPGKIYFAGNCASYGNCIVIEYSSNLYSLFGHLETIDPRTIAAMSSGTVITDLNQRIGTVGTTGSSTDCHVHISFSDCGSVSAGCFSQGAHTPNPCDYLPNCDPATCQYRDQARGCAAP